MVGDAEIVCTVQLSNRWRRLGSFTRPATLFTGKSPQYSRESKVDWIPAFVGVWWQSEMCHPVPIIKPWSSILYPLLTELPSLDKDLLYLKQMPCHYTIGGHYV